MATYSYVDLNGQVKNYEADSPNAALSGAPNLGTHSGVINPPLNGGNSTTDPSARTGPSARIDPNTFAPTLENDRDGNNIVNGLNYGDYNPITGLSNNSVAKISDRYSQQLRDEMDLINSYYGSKFANQVEANRGTLARAKVLNSNTGNIDSGTGASAIEETTKKGAAAIDAVENEKVVALQHAVGQIDDLKYNAIKDESSRVAQDSKAYADTRLANATKAQDVLKSYLSAGGNIEKLKTTEPESYAALSKALGGDMQLESQAIAFAPKDTFVSDKPEIMGNKAIWFKKDPKTGAISQVSVDIPGDKGIKSVTRVPGEGLYVFHNDGSYQVLGGGGTTTTSTKGVIKSSDGKRTLTQSDIVSGQQNLDSIRGADKYVDPYKYLDMYNYWVKNGFNALDFVKSYPPKNYINPGDNSILPPNLRTAAKASTPVVNPFAS